MNREEFDLKMRSADAKLRQQGFSIRQRAHRAFVIIAPNCSFIFQSERERKLFPEREYDGQDLYDKVHEWYLRHYGERSRGNLRFDSVPIIALNDIFFMRIPIFFGAGPHRINFIELVEGFTPLTGSLLTDEEMFGIGRRFEEGCGLVLPIQNLFKVMRSMPPTARLANDPFLTSADRDREIARRSLTIPYDTNNSAFHSQQFAEKMLKSLLFSAEGMEEGLIRRDFGHGIVKIWEHVKTRYQSCAQLESSIQAVSSITMQVRYSLNEQGLGDAVKIFWESLRVSAYCAEILQGLHRNQAGA